MIATLSFEIGILYDLPDDNSLCGSTCRMRAVRGICGKQLFCRLYLCDLSESENHCIKRCKECLDEFGDGGGNDRT
jgi:hypothetical protein